MAKTIQDLRRERGYLSAREFADALGVSRSSISRYDKEPDSISLKVAWAMADALGCSIDAVVGRTPVEASRGSVQEDYDALSPESRELVEEFIGLCQARDARAMRRRQDAEDRKYEQMARLYENMLWQTSLEGANAFGDALAFGGVEEEREAFRSFVAGKAAEKRDAAIREHLASLSEDLRDGWLDIDGMNHAGTPTELNEVLRNEADQMESDLAERDEEVITKIVAAYDRIKGYDAPQVTIEYMART